MKKKILFVCTGNTCRSVIAEGLFRKMVPQSLLDEIEVDSAGIYAYPGSGITNNTNIVLRQEGVNLEDHKAKRVSKEDIREADLILTMEAFQKMAIISMDPEAEDKVFLLKEFAEEESFRKLSSEIASAQVDLDKRWEQLPDKRRRLKELYDRYESLKSELRSVEDEIMDVEEEIAAEMRPVRAHLESLRSGFESYDIQDPFGSPLEIYERCKEEIKRNLEKVIEKILKAEAK
ncbi:MAG: arsenate reductase/protein-tyrosine-phosphatase family protein [bacterium]